MPRIKNAHPFQRPFTIAKITEKKYADALLDGEVFARPLHAYGSWDWIANRAADPSIDNSYRGDPLEGSVRLEKWQYGDIHFIDDRDTKYMKNYSTLMLEYDPSMFNTDMHA